MFVRKMTVKGEMMKRLMMAVAAIATCALMYGCGGSSSISDIQNSVKESMRDKGIPIQEVTLSKTGENQYHGMAKDTDGDFHSIDVTVAGDSVMWEIK